MIKIKNKIFASCFVFIFLTAAFLYAGENYFVKEIGILSAEIVSKKIELYNFESRNERLAKTREDYNEIKYELNNVSGVVVDQDKIVEFIEEIENTAEKSKVKFRMQSVVMNDNSADSGDGYISQKKFSITAAGDFNALMNFLYSLENFKYYMNMNNIRIEEGSFDEHNKDMLIMNADITVYQKQNE